MEYVGDDVPASPPAIGGSSQQLRRSLQFDEAALDAAHPAHLGGDLRKEDATSPVVVDIRNDPDPIPDDLLVSNGSCENDTVIPDSIFDDDMEEKTGVPDSCENIDGEKTGVPDSFEDIDGDKTGVPDSFEDIDGEKTGVPDSYGDIDGDNKTGSFDDTMVHDIMEENPDSIFGDTVDKSLDNDGMDSADGVVSVAEDTDSPPLDDIMETQLDDEVEKCGGDGPEDESHDVSVATKKVYKTSQKHRDNSTSWHKKWVSKGVPRGAAKAKAKASSTASDRKPTLAKAKDMFISEWITKCIK